MNNARILVCTPYRATTHPRLIAQWLTHADALAARWPQMGTQMLCDGGGALPKDGRFSAHARARNAVLDAIDLGAYDYLYWIDVDMVQWPSGLIDWALDYNPDGISAPAVVLHRYVDRFYDTWGFIHQGQVAALYPPWFASDGPVLDMESVGCCYLLPAQIYRDGARYQDTPGATEHYSVMQAARSQGRRVLANLEIRAVHAYLPDYGEALH